LFGASYVGIAFLAHAVGALPALTLTDMLLSAPLVPLAAMAGGTPGDRLASWLQQVLFERQQHDRCDVEGVIMVLSRDVPRHVSWGDRGGDLQPRGRVEDCGMLA